MTFEQDLAALVEKARRSGTPQVEVEQAVRHLYAVYGREIPPPITGTITVSEPSDAPKT